MVEERAKATPSEAATTLPPDTARDALFVEQAALGMNEALHRWDPSSISPDEEWRAYRASLDDEGRAALDALSRAVAGDAAKVFAVGFAISAARPEGAPRGDPRAPELVRASRSASEATRRLRFPTSFEPRFSTHPRKPWMWRAE